MRIKGKCFLADEKPLTLMLELSMFSKSSGEILGTLLTRSIKKRPTLLSAATLPDWDRSNRITFEALCSTQPFQKWSDKEEQQEHQKLGKQNLVEVKPCISILSVFNTHQHILDVCKHCSQHVLYPGSWATHLGQVRGQTLGTTWSDACLL